MNKDQIYRIIKAHQKEGMLNTQTMKDNVKEIVKTTQFGFLTKAWKALHTHLVKEKGLSRQEANSIINYALMQELEL